MRRIYLSNFTKGMLIFWASIAVADVAAHRLGGLTAMMLVTAAAGLLTAVIVGNR